ncbi:MAG: hypothetical protein AB1894_16935 [Chloroflexota bacterium]
MTLTFFQTTWRWLFCLAVVLAVGAGIVACRGQAASTPELDRATPTLAASAAIMTTFDLGGGGSGFTATIYAQEVTSGRTFHVFYPAGSHGGAVLPTSPPVTLLVEAPGAYVFYARLINAPNDYHYGATGCQAGQDCASSVLVAIDVVPGGVYPVTIADRAALLPIEGQPVTVPWTR